MNQPQQNGYTNEIPRNLNDMSLSSDGEQQSKSKKQKNKKKKINLNNKFKEEQVPDKNHKEYNSKKKFRHLEMSSN